METNNNNSIISKKFSNREALLTVNSELIAQLQARLKAKRFRPVDGDSVKLGYARALIQALQAQNAILKDAELDDLKKEIEELKDMVKYQSQY
jgi:fatty acid-binding protein DegV